MNQLTTSHAFRHLEDALSRVSEIIDTPSVVVVREVLESNIRRMQDFSDERGVALRPHVKTHKSVDIARMQRDAGARGISVANLSQAEVFAGAGFDDIFLTFSLWTTPVKAARIRRITAQARLLVGIESFAAVDACAAHGLADESRLGVMIEIDCGAGRTGIAPHLAGDLARYAVDQGFVVDGVFTYPGHGWAAGAGEGAADDQAHALTVAVQQMRESGVEPRIVSAGSTPTARFSPHPGITEIRPGEYVFFSMDQVNHGVCAPQDVALFVAATVVSTGSADREIIDVGTMVIGREGDERGTYGQVAGEQSLLRRVNEYHGFLDVSDADGHDVGTLLALIPNHSCTAVQNTRSLVVIDDRGGHVDRWAVSQFGPGE